ncbi:MAG: hypothetical protein J1G04_05340 [Clostridiales bacterium]|nr:hypothetical protein [Clostridiales bacterium]
MSISPEPGYKVIPVTLYVVEKTNAYGSSYNNTVPDIRTVAMDIVFRMENSRPKVAGNNVVDLGVGEQKTLRLSEYYSDADGAISGSTHSITSMVVPTKEIVLLDRHAVIVPTTGYNEGAGTYTQDSEEFLHTASTATDTGFSAGIVYNATAGGNDTSTTAFMRYTYSGDSISVMGLRPSYSQYKSGRANAQGHFYLVLHIQDRCEVDDDGIWLPLAFRVGRTSEYAPVGITENPGSATSQGNANVYPTADGGVDAEYYFAPMSVNYNGIHVVGKYKLGDEYTAVGLQPLGADGDSYATETGLIADASDAREGKLNELLTLSRDVTLESIVKSISSDGYSSGEDSEGAYAQNRYVTVRFIKIYIEKDKLASAAYEGGRIVVNAGGSNGDDGYKHITLEEEGEYYIVTGLKIKLRSATMNRYMYAQVFVEDAKGTKNTNGIEIAIRVRNSGPKAYAGGSANVATYSSGSNENASSTYTYDSEDGESVPTVTYRIPLGATVAITPYDLVYDYDIDTAYGAVMRPEYGFTLNGLSGRYDNTGLLSTDMEETPNNYAFNGIFDASRYGSNEYKNKIASTDGMLKRLEKLAAVRKVSAGVNGTVVGSVVNTNANVYGDRLYFARNNDGDSDGYTYNPTGFAFVNAQTNTESFVTCTFGNKVRIDGVTFDLDYVILTADTRTMHPASIELTVRDRYGDSSDGSGSITIRVEIEVVNTAPEIKNKYRYEELAAVAIKGINDKNEEYTVMGTSVTLGSNGNGNSTGLMRDIDADTPEFVTSLGTLLANTPDLATLYKNMTSFDGVARKYTTDDGEAEGRSLTEYMTATLTTQYTLTVSAISSTKAIASGVYVYFFVSDGKGGTSLGYVRIEVINTAPELNTTEEYGFDANDPLWSIESTSTADINRDRYIVGGDSAIAELKTARGAVDADIKKIATDGDGLHSLTVLSPIKDGAGYINLQDGAAEMAGEALGNALDKAVPEVIRDTGFGTGGAPAVAVYFLGQTVGENGETEIHATTTLPDNYVAELLFYVQDGETYSWIQRNKVIEGIVSGKYALNTFFDAHGRWIYTEWALRLRANAGFKADERISVTLSVRDQASLGGDTAGKGTAYNSDRRIEEGTDVDGSIKATVYQFIASTGIRTKDEFAKYNDYYVVEHTDSAGDTTTYVPTYDGNESSAYTNSQIKDIKYSLVSMGESSSIRQLKRDGSGEHTIKERAPGNADGTLAGVNSGMEYAEGIEKAMAEGEAAYVYPSVIEIPTWDESTAEKEVYIPMSFFGLLSDLTNVADNGAVEYSKYFVGYEVGSGTYSVGELSRIGKAITLSDGVHSWTGEDLDDNPYVNIDAFEINENSDGGLKRAQSVYNEYSREYFNNRLSVLTVNEKDELLGYEDAPANKNNFVGDGRLMYLAEQAERLQEHNFGLVFSKKDVRTGTHNLTLTIKLARSIYEGGNRTNIIENRLNDTRTVTVGMHVENAKLDLYARDGAASADDELKYDIENGTYYYDVTMATATAQEFALVRRDGTTGDVEEISGHSDAKRIVYTDSDYSKKYKESHYRDMAYFLMDSFTQLSNWTGGESGLNRVMSVEGGAFTNTSRSARAQNSMKNYFGVQSITAASNGRISGVAEDYQPNSGIYGTNTYGESGTEGYSSYFTASLAEGGRVLNIMSGRKTFINEFALADEIARLNKLGGKQYSITSTDDVKEIYKARGLVAEYATGNTDAADPTRVYYPFKVLVYDSCGVGRDDGAYVAVEIRITITNAAPTLKNVGKPITTSSGLVTSREYTIDLAVGSMASINLYDIVSDADIYVESVGGYNSLATKTIFESRSSGVSKETGDYLDSPFAHDKYLLDPNTVYDADASTYKKDGEDKYYRDGGGFTPSTDATRDVVMWMEKEGDGPLNAKSVPMTNNIRFKVNRRTTTKVNGRSVSVDEYRFTLRFYDSLGLSTQEFVFVINVTNQTPTLTATARNFTMRVGDDLTVLTTYYDTFIGGGSGSEAYMNSATYGYYRNRTIEPGYGDTVGDGYNNATGSGNYWIYSQITSEKGNPLGQNGGTIITDSTNSPRGTHLGYLGLANDDTPWRLRITNVRVTSNKIGWDDLFSLTNESGSVADRMAIRIYANGSCVNEPITITLSDGENGIVTVTLYITVVSSKPVARNPEDVSDAVEIAKSRLEGTSELGVYNMFTVPNGTETMIDPETSAHIKYSDFSITDMGEHRAYSTFRVELKRIAEDPDGGEETENMTLYRDGSFTVNGVELVRNGSMVYSADYFDITVGDGGRSFTLVATGFNAGTDRDYEELKFLIADPGNGDYANTTPITIHVYTMYSDMTNPTVGALDEGGYVNYLKGSNEVEVKSYDDYYGSTDPTPTEYNYVSAAGAAVSPIADRDALSASVQPVYAARLYAFMELNSDTQKWNRLSEATLGNMLERNARAGTFVLRNSASARSSYLIGGITEAGGQIVAGNDAGARLDAVLKYVDFEFTEGGKQILFTPKTATFDSDVLLYIEVEKPMSRLYGVREGAVMRAGTLFKLKVADSAPNAVRDTGAPTGSNFAATGAMGDVITFKIHDPNDPYGAMFTDADADDKVTVAAFGDGDYATALAAALEQNPELDWAASEGKPRAFDVEVDAALGTLSIRINRRMDSFDERSGKYLSSVSFPVTFTGRDRGGKTAQTTVLLTVNNKRAGVAEVLGSEYDNATGAGYEIDADESGNYVINAKVKYGSALEVPLDAFMYDPDAMDGADVDSYMFVGLADGADSSRIYPYSYLGDVAQTAYWYDTTNGTVNPDISRALATVEPMGKDKWHRTGIRITAADTTRALSAKTYIRVIDRAGNKDNAAEGVYVTLNIVILNEAPYVKEGMESSTVIMTGSDSGQPKGMLFFIGDFVADANESDVTGDRESLTSETYLRIFSQQPLEISSLYSTKYTTLGEDYEGDKVTSSALFTVTLPTTLPNDLLRELQESGKVPEDKDTSNLFNQWFLIMPREGYYGEGAFEITINDGNANTHYDTLTTTFRINVRVMYNPDEAGATLNTVNVACAKTKTLDITTLMPELENKIVLGSSDDGVAVQAEGDTFSQAEYYTITDMRLQNSGDSNLVTIQRVDDTGVWTVTAGNQETYDPIRVNVTYALNTDPSKTYNKYFWLNIVTNQQPRFKFENNTLTFVRYDRTGDILIDLDDSASITLEAWQLFEDPDDETGMALRFVSVTSKVPSLVTATLSEDKRFLTIKFAARGESEITVEVTDETGVPVTYTFVAKNDDLPEGSLWLRLSASFESNKVIWIVIICSIVLVLILLIVIIAVVIKKKRAREELEALLVSEMEIEEQMLRLAGGPSPTDYQSYGFLPPTPSAEQNNLLIGAGSDAPAPTTAALPPPTAETGEAMGEGGSEMG